MGKKLLLIAVIALILVSSVAFGLDKPNVNAANAMTGSNAVGISSATVTILGVAQWIGFIVGIAMIIWVGVKYLTAGAGSKAQVKSTMIPILVGAFLVALAPIIANWLFNAFGTGE